jgi:hypothetical protein
MCIHGSPCLWECPTAPLLPERNSSGAGAFATSAGCQVCWIYVKTKAHSACVLPSTTVQAGHACICSSVPIHQSLHATPTFEHVSEHPSRRGRGHHAHGHAAQMEWYSCQRYPRPVAAIISCRECDHIVGHDWYTHTHTYTWSCSVKCSTYPHVDGRWYVLLQQLCRPRVLVACPLLATCMQPAADA